jgi:hypothetical protein
MGTGDPFLGGGGERLQNRTDHSRPMLKMRGALPPLSISFHSMVIRRRDTLPYFTLCFCNINICVVILIVLETEEAHDSSWQSKENTQREDENSWFSHKRCWFDFLVITTQTEGHSCIETSVSVQAHTHTYTFKFQRNNMNHDSLAIFTTYRQKMMTSTWLVTHSVVNFPHVISLYKHKTVSL